MTDSPRPAGRRWAGRLRRSGSFARQVLLVGRPGRRRADAGPTQSNATTLILPERPDAEGQRRPRRRTSTAYPGAAPAAATPLLPGERTLNRRIRFLLVNACTVASLALGMSAIFLALNHLDVPYAALCLIACVIFDGLDGALARKLGVSSAFGAQMDSLADMCSFGIAAPVVVYAWLAGAAPAELAMPACALVAVCAAIRLARFNVSPKDGRFFTGVPTTMAAAVLALGVLIAPQMPVALRLVGVALLALAMVSSFPYAKLARLLRLPPWLLVLPVVGALIDYHLTFAGVVAAYLLSGPLLWLRQRGA